MPGKGGVNTPSGCLGPGFFMDGALGGSLKPSDSKMSIWRCLQCKSWILQFLPRHCVTLCYFELLLLFFRLLPPLALWSSLPLESCLRCLSWLQGSPYCWRWVAKPVPYAHPWWFPQMSQRRIPVCAFIAHRHTIPPQAPALADSDRCVCLQSAWRSVWPAYDFLRLSSERHIPAVAHPPTYSPHPPPLNKST